MRGDRCLGVPIRSKHQSWRSGREEAPRVTASQNGPEGHVQHGLKKRRCGEEVGVSAGEKRNRVSGLLRPRSCDAVSVSLGCTSMFVSPFVLACRGA